MGQGRIARSNLLLLNKDIRKWNRLIKKSKVTSEQEKIISEKLDELLLKNIQGEITPREYKKQAKLKEKIILDNSLLFKDYNQFLKMLLILFKEKSVAKSCAKHELQHAKFNRRRGISSIFGILKFKPPETILLFCMPGDEFYNLPPREKRVWHIGCSLNPDNPAGRDKSSARFWKKKLKVYDNYNMR
ncbi:MAG: hypothetical protein Q8L27_00830 [archaeon]|nr:hypothetical protein [archaeon]